MTADKIAAIVHEANRALCASQGDFSQPAWENAPAWQRSSAIDGVVARLANPESTPEQSHENWLAFKRAGGWTYGPTKDPTKKTHPCMVPYAELPPEQQVKDHLFVAIVDALASAQ